jgi:hypothetical protein
MPDKPIPQCTRSRHTSFPIPEHWLVLSQNTGWLLGRFHSDIILVSGIGNHFTLHSRRPLESPQTGNDRCRSIPRPVCRHSPSLAVFSRHPARLSNHSMDGFSCPERSAHSHSTNRAASSCDRSLRIPATDCSPLHERLPPYGFRSNSAERRPSRIQRTLSGRPRTDHVTRRTDLLPRTGAVPLYGPHCICLQLPRHGRGFLGLCSKHSHHIPDHHQRI